MTTVTENYLDGIREGRSLLKRLQEQHPALVAAMQRKANITTGANDHD